MAGFAAHRGYLDWVAVVGIAAAAGFAGDQFYFWRGRRHGATVLVRWPSLAQKTSLLHRRFERYQSLFIIGTRFAYGLRTAGPIVLGTMPLSWARYTAWNAVGATLWAILFGALGWAFGEAAQAMLGNIRHLEGRLFLAIAVAGAVFVVVRRSRARAGS